MVLGTVLQTSPSGLSLATIRRIWVTTANSESEKVFPLIETAHPFEFAFSRLLGIGRLLFIFWYVCSISICNKSMDTA